MNAENSGQTNGATVRLSWRRRFAWVAFGVVAVLAVPLTCTLESEQYQVQGVDNRLTILHTSDMHSRLLPYDLLPTTTDQDLACSQKNGPFGGAARLASIVRRERRLSHRVLHLDSGDCFQGAPIFNQFRGEAEVRFMSLLEVDAAVVGNHEFDAGISNLTDQLERWGTYRSLAANYIFPDPNYPGNHQLGRLVEPYQIFNAEGVRVAVIGMANLSSLSSIGEGGNSLNIIPLEQNETLRHYVSFLHNQVDLIVIVSHLGLSEDEELLRGYEKTIMRDRNHHNWEIHEDLGDGRIVVWVPGVRNIDIIMGGHLHVVLNPPKVLEDLDGRRVIIAHSGAFAKYVGRLDAVLSDDLDAEGVYRGKQVVSHKYRAFPVDARMADQEDAATNQLLDAYAVELNRQLELTRVIGFAPRIIHRRSTRGGGDSKLGNLVTRAMQLRRRVEAEFGVTNTLGIRDNLYPGPITLETMFNVFPFENNITVMFVSGREVQEMLDFNTQRSAGRGCQSQLQMSGLSFTMNCAVSLENDRHPEQYVAPAQDIKVNGVPLDPDLTYKMSTNDYISRGGSGFRVLKRNTAKFDTDISMRDAVMDYLPQVYPGCGADLDAGDQNTLGQLEDDAIESAHGHVEPAEVTSGLTTLLSSVEAATGFYSRCAREVGDLFVRSCPDNNEACAALERVKGARVCIDLPCVIGEEDGRIVRLVVLEEEEGR